MSAHSRTRTTTAPSERVWEIWSDTSTWASWNPDVTAMDPGRRLERGAQVTMHTKDGRHHQMTVVGLAAGREFALETSPVPLSTFRFTCRVEPSSAGSTISQEVAMRGPVGWLMSATAGDRIAEGFAGVLDGLAAAAEA
jgi:uncharacterized protein YndB with AHSA1/START domain